jgi:hypothetical protein
MTETATVVPSTEVIETLTTFRATTSKLFGQELGKTHEGDVEYSELAENSAIPADSELTHAEIIKILNARRKAAARAEWNAELAKSLGISKPGVLDTDEGRVNAMAKVFRSMGKNEAEAVALAKAALQIG